MVYTPKVWRDDPTGGTPITAAELNRMETQYAEAMAQLDIVAANLPSDPTVAAWLKDTSKSTGRVAQFGQSVDQPYSLKNTSKLYALNAGRWGSALAAVNSNTRDAKVLIIGDSTSAGIGGSTTSTTFPQDKSWPSVLTGLMDDLAIPAAHGLAIPKSNSGAMPQDNRWTLGTGWTQGANFVGFGGKATNYTAAPGAGALTFNDPRVYADRFDVYYTTTNTGAYGQVTAVATGGTTFSASANTNVKGVKKLTVSAATAGTNNFVSITNSASSGSIYIVGIEPYFSGRSVVRVGNAAVTGSNTSNWISYESGNSANTWTALAAMGEYQPDLVIIDLGINDAQPSSPVSVGTYISNLTQIIDSAVSTGASVVLKTMIPSGDSRYSLEAQYVAAVKALGYPVIDMFNRYGTYDVTNGLGWMSDTLHGNDALYYDEGRYVFSALFTTTMTPGTVTPTVSGLAELPVLGYTDRWRADQLAQTVGSYVNVFPGVKRNVFKPDTASSFTAPKLAIGDGNRKVIRFNGTTDGLRVPLTRTQPHSVVVVGRLRSNNGGNNVLAGASTATGSRSSLFINSANNVVANAGSSLTLASPNVTSNVSIFIGVFNGTSSVISLNGTEITGNTGTEGAAELLLGRFTAGNGTAIDIEEVIVYPFALSSSERLQVITAVTPA